MKKTLPILILLITSSTWIYTSDFEYLPGTSYESSVPDLRQTVGHHWGERLTSHAQAVKYLRVLTNMSDKVHMVEFGRTWEERTLNYLVIGSSENLRNIDEIKKGIGRLADPGTLDQNEASVLVDSLPVIVWLSYGIHGNELSSPEAALLTAYHLVAAVDDPVTQLILENALIIIDPMQNPDGRDRFINYFRETTGPWPDPDPQAAEHNERWPSGRMNHYLFDMNRDWFAMTQLESRARVKAFRDWYPQVFVDLHEMGSNSTYYFPPAAPPKSPHVTNQQFEWLRKFGLNNSRWFDRFQFDYFTGEVFDAFYPGYGVSWPTMHGAIGMTYEQASVRGLIVQQNDDNFLHFRDSIQHHFIASISTAENAAQNRKEMLQYFLEYRRTAIEEGKNETTREFIIPPGPDVYRSRKLAGLLVDQGVVVKRANTAFSNDDVRGFFENQAHKVVFPAGTFVIPLSQPGKRLIRTLLDREIPLESDFLRKQLERNKKRQSDQIYDVTAWSLPLLYNTPVFVAEKESKGDFEIQETIASEQGSVIGEKAKVAYLFPWNSNRSGVVLSRLFKSRIRVHSAGSRFKQNGVEFPAGTLIVKVKDNESDLHETIAKICSETGVNSWAADSGWVEEGINFGSNRVRYLTPPRIALLWSEPTHPYSAGWSRYRIEQSLEFPVTLIHANRFNSVDLNKYNVLILPNSSGRSWMNYSSCLGKSGVTQLKTWISTGGTLITLSSATQWLTTESVGLLATNREYRFKPGAENSNKSSEQETTPVIEPLKPDISPEKELPASVPGALVRVRLDTEHWLAFGCGESVYSVVEGRNIFTPLKMDKGTNVGTYASEAELLASGFMWDDSKKQLANKAFLMHSQIGQGHVISWAEDPNYRAYLDGLFLLFANGVLFGPSY